MFDTAIIGAGASGLFSAIIAARRGKKVLLCERLPRVGKKVLSTGNGRCNISNTHIAVERYHGTNPMFASSALSAFSEKDTVEFFESIGLPLIEGESGKLFPQSLQATSVLDLMRLELERLHVTETVDCFISSVNKKGDFFQLQSQDGRSYTARTVIIAAGGKAAPSMGTDGSAYLLCTSLGHSIIKPLPALCQLKSEPPMRALKGVKHQGTATIFVNNTPLRSESGEILFTDYGISGPPVFNLSRIASKAVADKNDIKVQLNFFPGFNEQSISEMLKQRRSQLPHLKDENFLFGLIPKLLAKEVYKHSSSDNALAKNLTSFTLKITGVMPWANAQVTAGGVDTKDVNPKTMESKITPGLFFCGEILDIDGDCGGFNLQWAWSSAYAAATNI